MGTFSALLAICAGNSPVPGEFHAQRPVTRSFDVFFDLRLNKSLSRQSWGWRFETLSRPLWRQSNVAMHWYTFDKIRLSVRWWPVVWYKITKQRKGFYIAKFEIGIHLIEILPQYFRNNKCIDNEIWNLTGDPILCLMFVIAMVC